MEGSGTVSFLLSRTTVRTGGVLPETDLRNDSHAGSRPASSVFSVS